MGWMSELYKTYEHCSDQIATPRTDGKPPLLPVAHTMQKAHIEMELDENANVISARTLGKDEADTILPCTEDSSSRTSGDAPHMLYDSLLYIAGDGQEYGIKNKTKFELYLEQLGDWCDSAYCTDDVRTIYQYIKKKTIVTDLVQYGILFLDDSGKLKKTWSGDPENKPLDIEKALVRFRVVHPGKPPVKCNENKELCEVYQTYYLSKKRDKRICYVTGKEGVYTEKHASRLRSNGDSAKLVSSPSDKDIHYHGRFKNSLETVTVSYEVSQKAHHMLRWLIATQGWKNDQQTILVWGTEGGMYPDISGDSVDIFGNPIIEEEKRYSTRETVAKKVKRLMAGYGKPEEIEEENVIVMAIDSTAKWKGRLSVTYYNEMKGSDFIENLRHWYSTCLWNHDYKSIEVGQDEKGKPKYRHVRFTGTPAPKDIVFAVFGPNADEKVTKFTIERLLPCITDRRKLPKDIMLNAVHRASRPQSMEYWQWKKTLSIACALVKKYHEGEEWDMALNRECRERNYVFGRLLAYADNIEQLAQWVAGNEKRETNAMKFQEAFTTRPAATWMLINKQLHPYKTRILKSYFYLLDEMNAVLDMLSEGGAFSNQPLNEKYLLGYASQMTEFAKIRQEASEKRKNRQESSKGGNE